MSAARIREAAKVLRDAAEGATPGPWEEYAWQVEQGAAIRNGISPQADPGYEICEVPRTPQGSMDSYYMSTMQPPVALALADWLDGAVERHAVVTHPNYELKCCLTCDLDLDNPDDGPHCPDLESALTLADTILGGKS